MEAAPKLKLVDPPEDSAQSIPLDQILISIPDNIRSEYDADSITRLSRQLLEQGQLQSILVEPLSDPGPKGERYRLVAGYRRYFAAKEAGISSLFAIVRRFDDKGSALAANAAENIEREQISLFDILRRIRDLLEQEWTIERIVTDTGADPVLTPQLVFLIKECDPQLIEQLRYDESSKTISRLEWAAKNITGITKEHKFKNQVDWWRKRTAEGWRTVTGRKNKPRSASPEKIHEVAERVRAARGLHSASGWVSLTPQQADAVADAMIWCANPKGTKSPI